MSFFSLLNTSAWFVLADTTDAVIHSSNPWQLSFQDPASPTMAGIINLHHDIMFLVVLLSIFTCWLLVRVIYFFDMEETHSTPAFRQIYNFQSKQNIMIANK